MIKLTVVLSLETERQLHRRAEINDQLLTPDLNPEHRLALQIELGKLAAELATESEMAVRVAYIIRQAKEQRTCCSNQPE